MTHLYMANLNMAGDSTSRRMRLSKKIRNETLLIYLLQEKTWNNIGKINLHNKK